MTYPIPRRKRITSPSPLGTPRTRTSPEAGDSRRFTNFKAVVLPDPLRPSRIRISPARTCKIQSGKNRRIAHTVRNITELHHRIRH